MVELADIIGDSRSWWNHRSVRRKAIHDNSLKSTCPHNVDSTDYQRRANGFGGKEGRQF